jgi:hypothetical protein
MQAQSGVVQASHEGLPFTWEVDRANFFWLVLKAMVDWIGTPIWCNSSFAWIRYVGMVMNTFTDPKIVCLKRQRDELVDSFMRHWPHENFWTDPGSDHWDDQWPKPSADRPDVDKLLEMFPKYDLPKEDAIAAYYDEYYAMAHFWEQRLPANFTVVDMKHSLNTFEGQDGVLDFFDIPPEKRRHFVGVRLNEADRLYGALYQEKKNVHGTIRIYEDTSLIRQETLMSLRQQSGEIRGDVPEGLGQTDPAVSGGNGDGALPSSGGSGHPVSEAVGHGEHERQRATDDGDVVHGKGAGKNPSATP